MKWVLTIIFTAVLYLQYVADFYLQDIISESTIIILALIVIVMIGIVNILYAIEHARKSVNITEEYSEARRHMFIFKLITIPFFIVNFLLWMINVIVQPFIIPFLGLAVWLFVPIAIAATYFILLVTSSYSITTVVLYYKSKRITLFEGIIHIVLQLIFVADVVDAIYLFFTLKTIDKRELERQTAGA